MSSSLMIDMFHLFCCVSVIAGGVVLGYVCPVRKHCFGKPGVGIAAHVCLPKRVDWSADRSELLLHFKPAFAMSLSDFCVLKCDVCVQG